MKCKFPVLTKKIQYQPDFVCNVVKACDFLWNLGILTGDNKGYNPDEFPVEDEDALIDKIAGTPGGGMWGKEFVIIYGHIVISNLSPVSLA